MLRAILLDLDSLILNYHHFNFQAWKIVLNNFGYADLTYEDYLSLFSYSSYKSVLPDLLPISTMEQHERVSKEKTDLLIPILKESMKKNEIMYSFYQLKHLKSFLDTVPLQKICVCDCAMEEMNWLIEYWGLNIDIVISSFKFGKPRPNPGVIEEVMKRMKLNDEEVVSLMFSQEGVMSAKLAGLTRIAGINPRYNIHLNREETSHIVGSNPIEAELTEYMIEEGAKLVINDMRTFKYEYLDHV